MKSQLYFDWLEDKKLITQLTYCVKNSKLKRRNTQKQISEELGISQTKIKEIEKGTCKDFNAINNYINYYQEPIF